MQDILFKLVDTIKRTFAFLNVYIFSSSFLLIKNVVKLKAI